MSIETYIKSTGPFFAAFFVIAVVFSNNASAWQDNPFDPFATDTEDVQNAADNTTPAASGDPSLDRSLSDGVRLVIRSVREANPQTPFDLSRAIKSMLNIQQYGEAKRYLELLINSDAGDPEIFELAESMGADFFLELRGESKLQPQARQFADRVFATAKREAYAPDRIDQLIVEVSDDNRFVRSGAFRKLRLLGAPAVAVMLNVCEDKNRRKEIPFVQAALKQMGKPALHPLIGAVRADGTVAQAVAVGALSNIQSDLATDALLRVSISSRVPDSVREIAAEAIAHRGLATEFEIKKRIFDRANEYLDGKIALKAGTKGHVKIWNWNFTQGKLIATETAAEDAIRIMAVDLARDAYQLDSSNRQYRRLQLLTVLEATKRVLGPHRIVFPDEIETFVSELSTGDLDGALEDAMQRELFPAAIAAAELLGQNGAVSALMTADGSPGNLIRAILTGHRHLQFAAAKAISRIDPKQEYPGCSYVAKIMTLMANSVGGSAAVAVHPRPDSAQSLASSIFQTGIVGVTANSSRELFKKIDSDPDIEFVLITDSVFNPHYHEVVQQIRGYWLTQRLPIGLLVSGQEKQRRAKMVLVDDPLTLVMPITTNPKFVYTQIERLRQLGTASVVSNSQRDQHAQFALNWLAKTISHQTEYRFYHLSSYRDQLIEIARRPGLYKTRSDILWNLASTDAQRTIVDLASDISLAIADRKIFVNAFEKSVQQRGLLLTKPEISRQYDRYNASQSLPEQSQDILGSILDTIESKSSRRTSFNQSL